MDYVPSLSLFWKKSLDFGPLFFQIVGGPDLQLELVILYLCVKNLFVLPIPDHFLVRADYVWLS